LKTVVGQEFVTC